MFGCEVHGGRGRRFMRGSHGGGLFGQGGWGRGPGGRGGIGRFFEHGDIRLVVLGLLADKPRHGYEIIKEIEDRLQGVYSPSPGVVYPTLSLLEEQGLVEVTPEGAKKLYAVTADGRALLDANRATVDALFARMEAAGGGTGGAAPSVLRAMQNLRLALRLRLGRGGMTPEAAAAIAAALDAAATAVERT